MRLGRLGKLGGINGKKSEGHRVSESALSSCSDPESSRIHGDETVPEIEFVAHSLDPDEADVYWIATCNMKVPPPEPCCPIRHFAEKIVGMPSRSTYPFLDNISPLGLKHLAGTLVMGYERMELTIDYLESFFGLSRTGVKHLYNFKPHHHMEIVKVYDPIPSSSEDLFVIGNILHGGPVFWGHFIPKRVRATVVLHQSRFGSSIEEDVEPTVEDPIPSSSHVQGRSGCLGWSSVVPGSS
ncbi:hypothetical protein F2Q69_00023511 [Brassica cretica]|uniref:Uncharacterized protein n=1 Tax=Brassica cretica TaxID=69181 RepID=A0A8S9Q8B8_BRACR|nr:hypothetical protein F2Q69_00023511 [Brassica cretica]